MKMGLEFQEGTDRNDIRRYVGGSGLVCIIKYVYLNLTEEIMETRMFLSEPLKGKNKPKKS